MTGLSDTPAAGQSDAFADLDARAADIDAAAAPGGAESEPPNPATPEPATAEILSALLSPAFAVLAPAWSVQPAECDALAQAWAPVLDKYAPDLTVGVELQAAIVTLAVLGPRLGRPAKQKPEPEPAPGGASGEPPPPRASAIPPGFEGQS